FVCVFICLQLSVLSTLKEHEKTAGILLFYLEMAMLFWFFAEYCIRVWCAGCRSRYQTWRGRLRFMHRPFCLVDATVIIASIVVLSMGTDSQRFAASPLRGLRFFQILRMIRMDRRGGSWKLLASVVWAHRQELFTTVYIGFLALISGSFLVYLLERDTNEKIRSYADALWWGVVTLCTVGYGDTVPKTWMGKIVAACCSVAGISFFALPAGILGSGFALKVQQHQREKHLIRRRVPAATLIQSLWRCYAADVNSTSVATWKVHMRALKTISTDQGEKGSSRLARFATVRRLGLGNFVNVSSANNGEHDSSPTIAASTSVLATNRLTSFSPLRCVMAESGHYEVRGNLIRNPSNARTYNESVTEDHSTNDAVENDLHLNCLRPDVGYESTGSLGSKATRNSSALKVRFQTLAHVVRSHLNLTASESSIYPNVSPEPSSVITDDGIESADEGYRMLTNTEKNVVRSIRKIKFFVARRKFKEALRPYDVKDVIEQYSAGHLDMLGRIKILQSRLDRILGRSSAKEDLSPESQVTLSSRIIKIEQKVSSIEAKLNALLNCYLEKQPTVYPHSGSRPDYLTPGIRSRQPDSLDVGPTFSSVNPLHGVSDHRPVGSKQQIVSDGKQPPDNAEDSTIDGSVEGGTVIRRCMVKSPTEHNLGESSKDATVLNNSATSSCHPKSTAHTNALPVRRSMKTNPVAGRNTRVHFSISTSDQQPTTSVDSE
ncbi:Potassium voltage-gated channel sub KQT member 5, partial [Clonorchis sinensis]